MTARLYHGGAPGLRVGGQVLPPEKTGSLSCADVDPAAASVCRRDRVYVTPSIRAARMFAAGIPDGQVYRVEPNGELEHDPDCSVVGLSYQCESARIVAIEPFSASARKRALRALTGGDL